MPTETTTFNLVSLPIFKKFVESTPDGMLKAAMESAIAEIEMHRKFNKDYQAYLAFLKHEGAT